MQHHKDNPITQVSPEAKDRIFQRFMNTHYFLTKWMKEDHTWYQVTPIEEAGITARLAQFEMDRGFSHAAHAMRSAITLLLAIEHLPWWGDDDKLKAKNCIEQFVHLVELFDWLKAYGPDDITSA